MASTTAPSTPGGRISSRGLFSRKKRPVLKKSDYSPSEDSPAVFCGCFGRRQTDRRKYPKNVRFVSGKSPAFNPVNPLSRKQTRGIRLNNRALSHRSSSRRSFYSCVSSVSKLQASAKVCDLDADTHPIDELSHSTECICGPGPHRTFDAMIPLITPCGVEPGSVEELLIHARALLGTWVTILDRSDSLDRQMIHVGIGKMKRMVINRLAIPLTARLIENDTLLDAWISVPTGDKHTTASLIGNETSDSDGDLGDWTATTSMVDYSCSWFCEGRLIRAMQLERHNPKFGTAFETRVIVPDEKEGKVLIYNVTMRPLGKDSRPIIADRIYRFDRSAPF